MDSYQEKTRLILELAKKFSSMDLLEKLPETIRVIALLVLQRGLEPRPLGRASPESCPDGLAAVEVPAAAARHGRPETSLVVDRVVVVVLVQRVTAEFYLRHRHGSESAQTLGIRP